MPTGLTRERVRRDVEVLAHAGLDTATFLAEVYESLHRAVASSAACVATVDPVTQLTTGAFKFGDLAGRDDTDETWGLLEYGHVEPTSFTQLARTGLTAVGMHVATGGDVRRSRRMQELVQSCLGCTDELRVLASAGGQVWGGVALFRDDRSAPYREEDVEFASTLSGLLARGLRVGLLARLAAEPPATSAAGRPAVMVFDARGRLQQASVGAEARLAQLVQGMNSRVPSAVLGSLIAGAWRYAAGATDILPSSRLRLLSGEWVVLHASPLTATDGSTASVVITVEEARPTEIVPLVVAAFDLTPREHDVTRLVLQGVDTREIAVTLHLSPHTVQDHLKSIFTKTRVSSRRELVARVFFDQYVPRLGGPLSPSGRFLDTPTKDVRVDRFS
jgi:DNA-binding CsgD family transcriptional regulator